MTFDVMMSRLRSVTDNMMSSLSQAYEKLPAINENIVEEGKDGEIELLKLMDRIKKLRDKVYAISKKKKS